MPPVQAARPRRAPFHTLILLLAVAMCATMGGQAAATPKDRLRAITAMDSGVSSLRIDPQGRAVTQKDRDAQLRVTDTNLPVVGNSDGMGTPADKTILESDAVFRQTNVASTSGTTSTATAYTLTEDMSGVSGTPTESPLSQRSLIDQQFPSEGGHYLDATHMGVLDFKQQVAGNDAVLSLSSPNQAVESDWTLSQTVTLPDPGTTFAFVQGSGASRTALTNSGIAGSKALGTQARSETLIAGIPDASQLWAVLDAGYNDGSFLLVNRADGLCLAWSGQFVSIDTCIDDPTRHWKYNNNDANEVWIFPSEGDSQSSLGSDGGQGVASTLGANTQQTWSALPLQEPGGSVPSWSVVRTGGATAGNVTPYDLAVGDLDGVVNQDDQAKGKAFHDEAVVVYGDSDDDLQIRVIDFHANGNRQLVTAPTQTLSLKGAPAATESYMGDVVAGIGDFNADGRNELAVGYQDSSINFTFSFWTYSRTDDGGRILEPYDCKSCNGVKPFATTKYTSAETGYADLTVGDVDGDGADDLALGFATWADSDTKTDHYANLGIWTLNRLDKTNLAADLTTRSVEVVNMPTDQGTLPRPLNADATRTQSGIRLAEGNLFYAPDNGFGPQRSEIAIAYSLYNVKSANLVPDIYTVQPVFAIFSTTVSDCNASLTTCETTTSQTNTQKTPSPLFPKSPTQWTYREKGTHFDAAPLSLVAGGFGGQDTDDPPVQGLLASMATEGTQSHDSEGPVTWYTQDAIVVPWSDKDKDSTSWAVSDTITKTGSNNDGPVAVTPWHHHRYTPYDRVGLSLVLGAPGVMDVEQAFKPTVIAAEPPTQVDWLNGGFSNISASSSAYLQTASTSAKAFTSGTERENTLNQNVHEGFNIGVSWGAYTYFGPDESGSAELQQKYTHAWSGLDQKSTNTSSSFTITSSAQTNQDDDVSYSFDESTLYRYPVLGNAGALTGEDSCQSGCQAYYDVIIPNGSAFKANMAGKAIHGGFFQPSWSNMNALSYQPIDSNKQTSPIPTPSDLGSYSYTDSSGTQTVTAPLYNASTEVGANTNVVNVDLSSGAGYSSTRTTSTTDEASVDASAQGTVGFGGPVKDGEDYVNLTIGASFGYDYSKTMSSSTTGTNTTTTDQAFELHYPVFDAGHGYEVGTIFYYAKDGSAKVVHAVDLRSSPLGKAWWNQVYGKTPNPALNLPGRIGLGYDSSTLVYDQPYWFTSPQRQLVRQFQTLQTDNDDSGAPTAGDPLSGNAIAGQRLTFQVPVHNYSLADMTSATTAAWYAVPVDQDDNDVQAAAISLGTSTVPAIPAQGVVNVQAPIWTAQASSANTDQTYRIFVQLDPDGTAPDMHPLAGDACPTDSLEPSGIPNVDAKLYDAMKPGQVTDPLGCGQDNQGYGLVTVSPEEGLGSERHASIGDHASAKLAGGGILDGNPDHVHLTEKSDVPTVLSGQRVTGIVRASSSLQLNDHPVVVVYDGPVSDGKVVAVTKLRGIDDETGGAATFEWTPDKPGVHELHTVLLSTKAAGQDDEQIMRVNVEALDPYTVSASASPSAVPVGGAFSITGSATPVGPTAAGRTVQLQQKVGSTWQVVDSQETSSKGRFDFDVVGTSAGSQTYRVWKTATSGRAAGASAPITVVVGGGFAVTAKATPSAIKLGQRATISGKVTPAVPRAADRKVELQIRSGSTWRRVTRGVTNAAGQYAFPVRPTRTGSFTYRVVKLPAAGKKAAASPSVTVRVTRR